MPKPTLVPSRLEKDLRKSVVMAKRGESFEELFPVDLPPGVKVNRKTGEFVLPTGAAERADILYDTRELRLSVERRLAKLKNLETELKDFFIETLPKSNSKGISGMKANVTIKDKPIPQVQDWDKFYGFVKKHNAWELLQRRLSEEAVKERMDEDKKFASQAGVTIFNAKKASVTKI